MKSSIKIGIWLKLILLKILYNRSLSEGYLGDIEEEYIHRAKNSGQLSANLWITQQIVYSLPTCLFYSMKWNAGRMNNYLKSSLRNMRKQLSFTIINILGYAIGIACTILIALWVFDELNFDTFHQNADSIYRIESDVNLNGRIRHSFSSPVPLAPVLQDEVPEVKFASRCSRFGGIQLQHNDNLFYENNVLAVDPAFFQMFTFRLIGGDVKTVLENPLSIVITQRTAAKYFGNENPIGKTLRVENQYDFTVTGLLEDTPAGSTIQPDIVIPFNFVLEKLHRMPSGWVNAITNYVMLEHSASDSDVASKITELVFDRSGQKSNSTYSLNPLLRVRLHTYRGFDSSSAQVKYVYMFSLIAIIVLIIACINFMNLSTARSSTRAKEIGMRKLFGADRGNIMSQFYSESVLLSLIALTAALVIVSALLPAFNEISGKTLSITSVFNGRLIFTIIGIVILTGFISGSYPALLLSSFKPLAVIKGILTSGTGKKPIVKRLLIIMQFSLSIILMIGTIVAFSQLNYMKNSDTGYQRENIVCIQLREGIKSSYQQITDELGKVSGVSAITVTGRRPSFIGDTSPDADWEGKDPEQVIPITFWPVEFGFLETLKIEMIDGRGFSREFPTDATEAFLINEETAELIGREKAVGSSFSMFGINGKVIGIMKNFHHKSLRDEIGPMAVFIAPNPYWLGNIVLRINPENSSETMENIHQKWSGIVPDSPFEPSFLSDDFERMYRSEERLSSLLNYFSVLAIIIACLGLIGLMSFTAEQKTKEIGIRKVIGATVPEIVKLLTREFIGLVIIANIIAWPVAYFLLQRWLQDFAFKAPLNAVSFLTASGVTLMIASITVAFHTIKAAAANPVNALRNE